MEHGTVLAGKDILESGQGECVTATFNRSHALRHSSVALRGCVALRDQVVHLGVANLPFDLRLRLPCRLVPERRPKNQ